MSGARLLLRLPSVSLFAFDPSGSSSNEDGIRRMTVGTLGRARIKTVKMTLVIISVFIFCWTPYYIMSIWLVATGDWFSPSLDRVIPSRYTRTSSMRYLVTDAGFFAAVVFCGCVKCVANGRNL